MVDTRNRLRVAFVAGTLAKGGAETQLLMIIKALLKADIEVQVYCATRGEFYEQELCDLGCEPIWYGQRKNPVSRMLMLTRELRRFRPHIIQSTHFYTNLYVAIAGRTLRVLAFGCLRSDAIYEVEGNGRWGRWLLKLPKAIIANSESARENVSQYGVERERISVLPNVIDLGRFDETSKQRGGEPQLGDVPTAIIVCRMVATKRLDRFLEALQIACQQVPLLGVFVGDGPERIKIESKARDLNLLPDQVRFLGWRDDVANLLRQADMMVICSDHEGFPNVLLEAMAAGLPAVGTPAGDIARVIDDTVTGFIVPFDDVNALADRMVQLANDVELRQRMGAAARNRVEKEYSCSSLASRLMKIYHDSVMAQGRTAIEPLLSIP